MKKDNNDNLKASSFAALALAFASFGDAFLYPFLPVNFDVVGISVTWVGVLLSINRFVRIISNTFIAHAFSKYGLRSMMIVAVILAVASTLGYSLPTGIIGWLFFRIVWGVSFSAMRLGTLGYALQQERSGLALGVSRSLQETGPMLALFIAPMLLKYFDPGVIFCLLALFSLPALFFAWRLPAVNDKTPPLVSKRLLRLPSALNSITLVCAIIIDGIIVVVLGVLFLQYRDHIDLITATILAASYLGFRRVCLVALSPVGGWLADRYGLEKVFNTSMIVVIFGLAAIAFGWIGTGAAIVFIAYSINVAITPGRTAKNNADAFGAVAENATWRDIGAALGTMMGGFLITSPHLILVIILTIFILLTLLLTQWGTTQKAIKYLYLWK